MGSAPAWLASPEATECACRHVVKVRWSWMDFVGDVPSTTSTIPSCRLVCAQKTTTKIWTGTASRQTWSLSPVMKGASCMKIKGVFLARLVVVPALMLIPVLGVQLLGSCLGDQSVYLNVEMDALSMGLRNVMMGIWLARMDVPAPVRLNKDGYVLTSPLHVPAATVAMEKLMQERAVMMEIGSMETDAQKSVK